MGSSKSGKPRYSAEVHATIIKHLKNGAFLEHAAAAAEVSGDAVREWVERGTAGAKRYERFARDVMRTQAEDAIRSQTVITAASLKHHVGDWKAAAWNLERKFPKLYGRLAEPAVGVTFTGGGEEPQQTRVEFYIPDNGRRPVEES